MIVEKLVEFIVAGISFGGYIGITILMALESMIAPVPSEVVMPFAGYLVLQGRFDFWLALLASSMGSIFGSLLSYYIGFYGGRPFILKFGKYFLLEEEHLEFTEKWFKKQGDKTILVSRFVPVVRHLISIPAGIARMPMRKFIIYTFVGATAWNWILLYAGFRLGSHWDKIHEFSKELDIVFIIAVVSFLVYFVWKHHKRRNEKGKNK
ncbi:DedA family protein [Candidatus Woesearchaeota archaeon]|nr:DedA family protein [Candidatus Woesearchaeota archaeon]